MFTAKMCKDQPRKKNPVFYRLIDKEYEENKEYHNTAHTEPKSGLGSMGAIF